MSNYAMQMKFHFWNCIEVKLNPEQCGMFNHLIYHQQPHHAISRPIALQMHQEWEKRQNEDIHSLDFAGRSKSTLR